LDDLAQVFLGIRLSKRCIWESNSCRLLPEPHNKTVVIFRQIRRFAVVFPHGIDDFPANAHAAAFDAVVIAQNIFQQRITRGALATEPIITGKGIGATV